MIQTSSPLFFSFFFCWIFHYILSNSSFFTIDHHSTTSDIDDTIKKNKIKYQTSFFSFIVLQEDRIPKVIKHQQNTPTQRRRKKKEKIGMNSYVLINTSISFIES
jgi:hypothetical protein